jgi:hypothetical protein
VYVRYFLKASFKFCLIILENRHKRWYFVENFYVSIECTSLKTIQVGIWSKMMIPCINIVYRRICVKDFLIIDNEVH